MTEEGPFSSKDPVLWEYESENTAGFKDAMWLYKDKESWVKEHQMQLGLEFSILLHNLILTCLSVKWA